MYPQMEAILNAVFKLKLYFYLNFLSIYKKVAMERMFILLRNFQYQFYFCHIKDFRLSMRYFSHSMRFSETDKKYIANNSKTNSLKCIILL